MLDKLCERDTLFDPVEEDEDEDEDEDDNEYEDEDFAGPPFRSE
jgi:hypothetical protein